MGDQERLIEASRSTSFNWLSSAGATRRRSSEASRADFESEGAMSDATVTVGIPTYNRAALLRESLESVLAQTYTSFRLVISDNASTDETADVVASYSDPRIEYIRNEQNIGMIANFNRLIELAETEFLMLLPDDDCLYSDYLGSVIEILQRHPRAGLVHTAFDEIDLDSCVRKRASSFVKSNQPWLVEPGRAFLERGIASIAICQSSATFRTRAIREAGGLTIRRRTFRRTFRFSYASR